MEEKLTFGGLSEGQKFIILPTSDRVRMGHPLHMKIERVTDIHPRRRKKDALNYFNAVDLSDGGLCQMADDIFVIRVM